MYLPAIKINLNVTLKTSGDQTYAIISYIHTHHKDCGNPDASSTISWRLPTKKWRVIDDRDPMVIVYG